MYLVRETRKIENRNEEFFYLDEQKTSVSITDICTRMGKKNLEPIEYALKSDRCGALILINTTIN